MDPSDRPRPVGRRRSILVVGLAVLAAGALAVALAIPVTSPSTSRIIVGGSPLIGRPAPEIDLEGLAGERIRLSDYRGQPVIVNFWASWCIPCRDEFPILVAAYEEHRDDGLEILGVVHGDWPDSARRFAADHGATWPMPVDADDVARRDYLIPPPGLKPSSFFIDSQGVVRASSLGAFTESGFESQLALILPSTAGTPAPPASVPGPPATSDR